MTLRIDYRGFETAWCMADACLTDPRVAPLYEACRENHGSAEIRYQLSLMAPALEADWDAVEDHEPHIVGSFDWDWLPEWLVRRVDWNPEIGPRLKPVDTTFWLGAEA